MTTAIYPGSFDPVTLGHLNIIKRAAACFDQLIVCVMVNSSKTGMFTPQERVELLRRSTQRFPNVRVDQSNQLLAAYAQEKNAQVLASQGAGILLREADCVENTLFDKAAILLNSRDRREEMVKALQAMAVPNAAEKIYETLREIMK